MKDFSKFLLAGLFTIGFSACSDDGIGSENGPNDGPDAVYMSFKLELPETRSETNTDGDDSYVSSTGGEEVGKDHENMVSNVVVVLTQKGNNTFIAASEVVLNPSTTDKTYYVVPFSSDKLKGKENTDINIFVYCNQSSDVATDGFSADKLLSIEGNEHKYWQNDYFYMSNANIYATKLPDSFLGSSESNPIYLGEVEVERSMARFDYKDGSTKSDYTYNLMKDASNVELVNVKLTGMALINLSKNFYQLRRVSSDTDGYGNPTLCGVETPSTWVVDTDARDKANYKPQYDNTTGTWSGDLSGNFLYSLAAPETWTYDAFPEKKKENEDNSDEWTGYPSGFDKDGYYIWRYATENTIPNKDMQKNGISTGVVFKGELVGATDDWKNKLAESTINTLYVFENKLIGSWDEVKTAAVKDYEIDGVTIKEYHTTPLAVAFKAVNDLKKEAAESDADFAKRQNAKRAEAGFTAYNKNTEGKYEMFYYYWNRHNDNNDPAVMGQMEFAVVRNNVYKLMVESINKFGHPDPTDPDPVDPDPVDPVDPDEDQNLYFKVAVKIRPWVVRINNIHL